MVECVPAVGSASNAHSVHASHLLAHFPIFLIYSISISFSHKERDESFYVATLPIFTNTYINIYMNYRHLFECALLGGLAILYRVCFVLALCLLAKATS